MMDAKRRAWRIWGGIAVIFFCGVGVGSVATSAYHEYERQHRWEQGLAGMKPRLMKYLTQELHLSEDQRRAVETIVGRAEAELLQLRLAQQPRVEEIVVQTTKSMKTTLTPEQQRTLDELYKNLQKRWGSDRVYVDRLSRVTPP